MACQPFTPFTPGQHLPRAGVTVLAVHLGTSASTTHYDLRFTCCGAVYALNHIILARRLAEERQSCRHCGPAHGGQRGGRTAKFKPHARGDHFPGAALTVIAVQLGATSDATHYTLRCDCGANSYTFSHKHLNRLVSAGRPRCRLCDPVASATPAAAHSRGWQPYADGADLPPAGLTVLAILGGGLSYVDTVYRVRYHCCGAEGALGHRVIVRRGHDKVQRCGTCARRANGAGTGERLRHARRIASAPLRSDNTPRWPALPGLDAATWPRPPSLAGQPPLIWGAQP
jgi:hypothetical protein